MTKRTRENLTLVGLGVFTLMSLAGLTALVILADF
jgi:hypothetical protein